MSTAFRPPPKIRGAMFGLVASASTVISRKDFGLTWNAALETGGVLVGDEVTIDLDVQFVKSQA
jgi:polyisoprenoid-binding protein YceI